MLYVHPCISPTSPSPSGRVYAKADGKLQHVVKLPSSDMCVSIQDEQFKKMSDQIILRHILSQLLHTPSQVYLGLFEPLLIAGKRCA